MALSVEARSTRAPGPSECGTTLTTSILHCSDIEVCVCVCVGVGVEQSWSAVNTRGHCIILSRAVIKAWLKSLEWFSQGMQS